MPSTRNIIVGAASLFISQRDTTQSNPAFWVNGEFVPAPLPTVGAAASIVPVLEADTNWRNVGYTTDGLTLSYEPTFSDVEVDQLLDSAKVFKSSMRATLATSFVEATLENLLVAWGQGSGSLSSTSSSAEVNIEGGALGDEPVERALVAVGPAPRSAVGVKRERVYYTTRVLSVDTTAIAVRRAEATMFPVSFRLLPTSGTDGKARYGLVRDRNNSA